MPTLLPQPVTTTAEHVRDAVEAALRTHAGPTFRAFDIVAAAPNRLDVYAADHPSAQAISFSISITPPAITTL